MNDQFNALVTLALHFSLLSFLAIGGAITALPEMHRQAVDVSHWMTSRQFTDLVAIAQAAPGPNVLIVTLIGNHVAGITGALVATFFMCGPACTVSFFVARVFDRFKDKPWRKAIQAGLVPVSVGLVASTALLIARSADRDIATLVVTGVTFALTYWTRISPLYALGAATAIGMAGGL
ncbi:MAG: chromate transporter [Xanthobacteraceae bacterium]